jgi:hypothetical protein
VKAQHKHGTRHFLGLEANTLSANWTNQDEHPISWSNTQDLNICLNCLFIVAQGSDWRACSYKKKFWPFFLLHVERFLKGYIVWERATMPNLSFSAISSPPTGNSKKSNASLGDHPMKYPSPGARLGNHRCLVRSGSTNPTKTTMAGPFKHEENPAERHVVP